MAPAIHEVAGQSGRTSGEREHREPKFERSPWTHVTCGERKNLQVTIWDGVKAIVIALSFADGNPEDIQVSVVEGCLLARGTAGNCSVSQTIELPCPVETRPIRIEDDKGTLFVLLQKK
jgi:HSP20 family molecular chaperone IbpA